MYIRTAATVAGNNLSIWGKDAGFDNMRPGRERAEDFMGRLLVPEGDRSGTVGSDNFGQGSEIIGHRKPEGDDVVNGEDCAGHEDGNAGGEENDAREFLPDGGVARDLHASFSPLRYSRRRAR